MTEIPAEILKVASYEAKFFAEWLRRGNSKGSLSEHAIEGLSDSIARALMARDERAAKIADEHAQQCARKINKKRSDHDLAVFESAMSEAQSIATAIRTHSE